MLFWVNFGQELEQCTHKVNRTETDRIESKPVLKDNLPHNDS